MQANFLPHWSGNVPDPLQYLTFGEKKKKAPESCTFGVNDEIQTGKRVYTVS